MKEIAAAENGPTRDVVDKLNEHTDSTGFLGLIEVDEEAVLRRAALELAQRKAEVRALALIESARAEGNAAIERIATSIEDESVAVRSAALRALHDLDPKLAASQINIILREGPPERRHKIGSALIGSKLADEAISRLNSENGSHDYESLSLIFLLAKSGTVEPLIPVIESYPDLSLRLALIKLLGASGQPEVISSFHTLTLNGSLEPQIRSALMATIYGSRVQVNSGS